MSTWSRGAPERIPMLGTARTVAATTKRRRVYIAVSTSEFCRRVTSSPRRPTAEPWRCVLRCRDCVSDRPGCIHAPFEQSTMTQCSRCVLNPSHVCSVLGDELRDDVGEARRSFPPRREGRSIGVRTRIGGSARVSLAWHWKICGVLRSATSRRTRRWPYPTPSGRCCGSASSIARGCSRRSR